MQRLQEAGVSETVIVVGYRHEDVQACVGDRVGGMRVTYRRNDEYRTTGTSRSLEIGITDLGADLLVLEGDVFFEPPLLPALIASPHVDATIVDGIVLARAALHHSLNYRSVVVLGTALPMAGRAPRTAEHPSVVRVNCQVRFTAVS